MSLTAEAVATLLKDHFAGAATPDCGHGVELARFASGDLGASETSDFAAHLEQCSQCRDVLAEAEAVEATWSTARAGRKLRWPRRFFSARLFHQESAAQSCAPCSGRRVALRIKSLACPCGNSAL